MKKEKDQFWDVKIDVSTLIPSLTMPDKTDLRHIESFEYYDTEDGWTRCPRGCLMVMKERKLKR